MRGQSASLLSCLQASQTGRTRRGLLGECVPRWFREYNYRIIRFRFSDSSFCPYGRVLLPPPFHFVVLPGDSKHDVRSSILPNAWNISQTRPPRRNEGSKRDERSARGDFFVLEHQSIQSTFLRNAIYAARSPVESDAHWRLHNFIQLQILLVIVEHGYLELLVLFFAE